MPPPAFFGKGGGNRIPSTKNSAVGEGFYPLPFSPKTVIASHAEGVARQSGNRTPLHSAECLTPTSQITTSPAKGGAGGLTMTMLDGNTTRAGAESRPYGKIDWRLEPVDWRHNTTGFGLWTLGMARRPARRGAVVPAPAHPPGIVIASHAEVVAWQSARPNLS